MTRSIAASPLVLFPGGDPCGILFGSLGAVERGLIDPHPVLIAWLLSLAPGIDAPGAARAALGVAGQHPREPGGGALLILLADVARCPGRDREGATAGAAAKVRRRRASRRAHRSRGRANLVCNES